MKILLSNDDGYQAPGLIALAKSISEIAQVTVVAPAADRSCASSSLTVRQPIRVRKTDSGVYYVDGTPGDCVHLALNGMLDFQPDMVVTGINAGANLGDDVIYSGTVAAAIEGRFLGLPAIAVSLVGSQLNHYETAAWVVRDMVSHLDRVPLPPDTILNVNVPDIPFEALKGVHTTRCGARHPSQPIVAVSQNGESDRVFKIGPSGGSADDGAGTDFAAVTAGKVSVTPLQIDMTRYSRIPEISPLD